MLSYCRINVLFSFERVSELEYKGIIMGYATFSLGCYMVWCSIASLAVGYIYFQTLPYLLPFCLTSAHLYSFASYNGAYALKMKYPVTRGCQFPLKRSFLHDAICKV